ncbi:plasmid maintenance protein [Borreliella bissettiae]|nr:plasmid maintenance protein [Borreliella bissettiae]
MQNTFINHKNTPFQNKLQHKLIVFISTLKYINSKYKKYTQNNILYYFNENLKRNGQPTVKLKTMQNYLYKLEKELKVTTNYHKHLGVNFGTEIYYKLNYPKKECHLKINQYFKEKKDIRFQTRVNRHLKDRFTKEGNLNFGECNNNNNNKEEETKNKKIEKYQTKKYFNKCNFLSKEAIYILDLNISKDKIIEILKIVKKIEINLTKKNNKNKVYFKERQNKLKEILKNIQKEFEKNGYDAKQMKLQIESIYKNYKNKPHFIIENKKYEDLNKIKLKLEKSIEIKKETPTKKYIHIRTNIFNILIEQLKKEFEIKSLKSIIKNYLNNKKPLEYNKVFSIYCYELLEIIKKEKNKMDKKLLSQDII